jgi:hypothetical protein
MQKTYTCKNCGKRVKTSGWADDLFNERLCFDCHFWLPKTYMEDSFSERMPLRANGVHYTALMDNSAKGFKGFGGCMFVFEFFDGRVLSCNNVWHQGTIPAKWREKLPDNGRFLSGEEVRERNLFPDMNTRFISSFTS